MNRLVIYLKNESTNLFLCCSKEENMKITKLLILTFAISLNTALAQEDNAKEFASNVEGSSLELPHIQVVPIKDTKTERNYELYVKLPEGYSENSDIQYPVIYYTDALWHLEMLSGSTEYMLEDVILVGISWQLDINEDLKKEVGEHVSRFRDYSFLESNNPEIQTKFQLGQANKHLDFIRNDVIKYVDNVYRTDPNSRTYFGYSMSGEFGAYILLTQPATFDNYILGSPSIRSEVDIAYLSELNSKLEPFDASNRNASLNANVFISYGSLELEKAERMEEFISLLNNRRDDGLSVLKEVIDGNHQTAFPMTTVRSITWLSSLMSHVSSNSSELNELPLWEIPQLNNAFINPTPEDRNDGLVVGELGVDGGDKEVILSLAQEIEDHKHGWYDSFLIAHKDKLIFESYYARGRINLPHEQASATKSYTSLALGRAIQLGYLTMADLDKPLVRFLKDLDPSKFVAGVEKITLYQALTMRGGLSISSDKWEALKENPTALKGQGLVQTLLEHSAPITSASQNFVYGNFNPDLVMQVIEAVVPGTAKDFIENELFGKIGITTYRWQTHIDGLPAAGGPSYLTSRDMLKLGALVINKGKWNGEQLISANFLADATSNITKATAAWQPETHYYGYFFYQTNITVGDKSYDANMAWGGGGQHIITVEELDLIVVITGFDGEDNIFTQVSKNIIPAFIK